MQLLLANVVAGKQYFLPTFQNSNLASVKSTEYCPAGGGRVFVGGFALIKKLSSIDLWKLLARPEVSTPLHSATPQPLCLPRPALPSISPKNILAFLQRIFSPFSKESFSISLQRSLALMHSESFPSFLSYKIVIFVSIFHCLVISSVRSPGNQTGPRGTARNDKSLKCFISVLPPETPWCCASKPHRAVPRNPCAAPRNPMVLCLETPGAPRLKTPGDKF